MAFWRKKNDEFEWNKYVRTTVLARRKERRQKLEDAGAAAIFGVRQARWKSAEHAKAVGKGAARASRAAGHAIRKGSRNGWSYLAPRTKSLAVRIWAALQNGFRSAGQHFKRGCVWLFHAVRMVFGQHIFPLIQALSRSLRIAVAPVRQQLGQPQIFAPLCLLAGVTALGALANWMRTGLTQETLFTIGLALSFLGLVVWASPRVTFAESGVRLSWPRLGANIPRRVWIWGTGLTAAIVVAGTAMMTNGFGLMNSASFRLPQLSMQDAVPTLNLSDLNPFESETVTGRARAVGAGVLRVGKQRLRLDGIEALLPAQTCKTRRNRTWRCGRTARSKLARIVRAGTVTCTVVGVDDDETKRAQCKTKKSDVAGELVRQGYAYADVGIFARYSDQEQQARAAKRGVWQGDASRPSDYRLAKWEQAAKKAPGGCPIKGRVLRRKRIYALPWDRGYTRMRVRSRRGERWFCSEKEARTAGFSRRQDT